MKRTFARALSILQAHLVRSVGHAPSRRCSKEWSKLQHFPSQDQRDSVQLMHKREVQSRRPSGVASAILLSCNLQNEKAPDESGAFAWFYPNSL
jgi:hypothetical protein